VSPPHPRTVAAPIVQRTFQVGSMVFQVVAMTTVLQFGTRGRGLRRWLFSGHFGHSGQEKEEPGAQRSAGLATMELGSWPFWQDRRHPRAPVGGFRRPRPANRVSRYNESPFRAFRKIANLTLPSPRLWHGSCCQRLTTRGGGSPRAGVPHRSGGMDDAAKARNARADRTRRGSAGFGTSADPEGRASPEDDQGRVELPDGELSRHLAEAKGLFKKQGLDAEVKASPPARPCPEASAPPARARRCRRPRRAGRHRRLGASSLTRTPTVETRGRCTLPR
jgi:hypothetical protein